MQSAVLRELIVKESIASEPSRSNVTSERRSVATPRVIQVLRVTWYRTFLLIFLCCVYFVLYITNRPLVSLVSPLVLSRNVVTLEWFSTLD